MNGPVPVLMSSPVLAELSDVVDVVEADVPVDAEALVVAVLLEVVSSLDVDVDVDVDVEAAGSPGATQLSEMPPAYAPYAQPDSQLSLGKLQYEVAGSQRPPPPH